MLSDYGPEHPCSGGAPGREDAYAIEFIFEQLRIASVWVAYWLLRSSRGGPAHLFELERSRLRRSGTPLKQELLKQSALASHVGASELPAGKRGGALRKLVAYDLAVFAFCYGWGVVNLWTKIRAIDCDVTDCGLFQKDYHTVHPGHHPDHLPSGAAHAPGIDLLKDWRFWMTLDFSETTYSLLLFPFALLCARPLKRYLTHAKPTGYDRCAAAFACGVACGLA